MHRQTNPVRPPVPRRTLYGEAMAFALVVLPLAALIEWRG